MNTVVYHKKGDPEDERIQMILNDADRLLRSCEGSFDEINQYQLLIRVIREQTIREKDGALRLRTKMDGGMDSNVLQNPADLAGRETKDIYADFVFSEDGRSIIACPAGNKPVSGSYVNSTGQCRASFDKRCCENCPHKDECNPKMGNKKAVVHVSAKSSERAKIQRTMNTETFRIIARIRNGVETIPSILRRRYDLDTMPVRGKIRMKHCFGYKIASINFTKLLKYLQSRDKCVQSMANG